MPAPFQCQLTKLCDYDLRATLNTSKAKITEFAKIIFVSPFLPSKSASQGMKNTSFDVHTLQIISNNYRRPAPFTSHHCIQFE